MQPETCDFELSTNMIYSFIPLLIGWILDLRYGDPERLPHPVVWFGKVIAWCERRWNHGNYRKLSGAVISVLLTGGTYIITKLLLDLLPFGISFILQAVLIFFCLAGTTLIREVRAVFAAADRSLEEGRKQVSRIVGRDTDKLSREEVHAAALETLAENLSDGVIAPLFWYILLGVPGMMAYKMVNTLDSMIGYRTQRYRFFGRFAARLDDVANYVPARLTALLMCLAALRPKLLKFVRKYGRCHASPNSGYPEAALAGILDCRFGGPHDYFGDEVWKPYIGDNPRPFTTADMQLAVRINRRVEVMMIAITVALSFIL